MPGDLPLRLAAVGAHRPTLVPDPPATLDGLPEAARNRLDLSMIAIGVYVRGTESMLARLEVPGGPDPRSADHRRTDRAVEQACRARPSARGLQVDAVADRLVLSGRDPGASGRPFALAFMSLVPLAGRAVDDALLEHRDIGFDAVGSS